MKPFANYRRWRPTPLMLASTVLTLSAPLAIWFRPELWAWFLLAVVADHLLLTFAGLWPRCAWLGQNWTSLPPTAAARGEVAITIDDGPNPEVTPAVLDILDRYQAKATFFCIGENAQRHPHLCRQIVERGHTIENHSMRHRYYFPLLSLGGWFAELQNAQQTLTELTGRRPDFFRAPAGLRNPLLDPVLSRLGLQLASWTRRGFDTVEKNPQVVLAKLLNGLKAGDILLLHDGGPALSANGTPIILEVLPPLLDAIAAAGLHSVNLRDALPPFQAAPNAVHR